MTLERLINQARDFKKQKVKNNGDYDGISLICDFKTPEKIKQIDKYQRKEVLIQIIKIFFNVKSIDELEDCYAALKVFNTMNEGEYDDKTIDEAFARVHQSISGGKEIL